ncbi:MAG: DUF4422 domain-containing protein, partial [Selenomonadaceae bacterium]|nr:DUF4422 domain-containing protein [Selenomonadaceae bacterium]
EAQLFFNGRALNGEDIRNLLDGAADYLIFTNPLEQRDYMETFPLNTQVISATAFAKKIRDGFFSYEMFALIHELLKEEIFRRVLDFDCLFAKSDFRTRLDLKIEIDCVAENYGGELFTIMENLYGKIYQTLDTCRYQNFDAIILSAERSPEEFVDALIATDNLTDKVLAFVRKGSSLETWLNSSQNFFAQVNRFDVVNGAWCLIEKLVPPVDIGVYVVTHKDAQLSALPQGYRIIHAGHALAQNDFGYLGDDTGDNISTLNPFLDELTALYWIWKNTEHTHTGIVHYRRFFTSNINLPCQINENKIFNATEILSAAEIRQILSDYDIIVNTEFLGDRTQLELMIFSTGQPDLIRTAEKIVRKHIALVQPDYLEAYDAVINGFVFFICGIFITRRSVFNAYCEWLFSFILDATIEMRDNITLGGQKFEDVPHIYSRVIGNFAERMLTIWLTKNHLRIKTLPIMYRDEV